MTYGEESPQCAFWTTKQEGTTLLYGRSVSVPNLRAVKRRRVGSGRATLKSMLGKCRALPLIVSVIFGFAAHGQISPAKPQNIDPNPSEFEVATIKPSTIEPGPRWFRFIDARRWTAFNQTLKQCIAQAYKLPPALISGGPAWVDSERYEIVAIEPGATRPSAEQNMLRFQNLLADRFKLRFHRERKQVAVYNLTSGKSVPKMTESTLTPEKGNLMISPSPRGGPLLPARAATMERFASVLQDLLDRPVIDKTGLTKRYDFDLEFSPEGTLLAPPGVSATPIDSPDIFTAIQRIGLKLEAAKGKVEVIAIDYAEKPGDN